MNKDGPAADRAVSARLYGMGAACYGNWTRSVDFSVLKWESETEDGDNVDMASYTPKIPNPWNIECLLSLGGQRVFDVSHSDRPNSLSLSCRYATRHPIA